MKLKTIGAMISTVALLTACAQQEEHTTMVAPEPTFDKYGNGSCDEGYTYVPGAAYENPCIPDDECVDSTTGTAAPIPCPPPFDRPDDDDDDDDSGRPAGSTTAVRG